jgi:integrase
MPVFKQKFIENLPPDGKYYSDEGGKNCVPGLKVRSGKKSKVFYVYVGRGEPLVKIGTFPGYTVKKARTEAKKKLGMDAGSHRATRKQRKDDEANTLESYLDGPFKEHAEANIASHKDILANIRRAFGHLLEKPMTEINDGLDMAKWRRARSSVSLETQRRELTYLKALLNHAVRSKAIPRHQLSHYKVKGTLAEGESEAKVRYLTPEEESRLRAAMDAREARLRLERANANKWRAERGYALKPEIGPIQYADHIKPIVLLALNTGLRRGDLFGLKWEHVDLGQRQIRKVIEKTSHARRKAGKAPPVSVLPLSAEAHSVLTQWKKQCDPDSPYVFASPRSGGRLDNINKAWDGLLGKAKITDFRFHDLRHTFASRLVMARVDINTVRELMTHSDIKMTLIYAHLSPDHKAAALDRAFGGTTI